MILGYNTNGFAFHRLEDALDIMARLGYKCVAITLDQHCLNPYSPNHAAELEHVRAQLQQLKMSSVIESGARFLLDPQKKHWPTLLEKDPKLRERRFDFLRRSIDIAAELKSHCMSFWSGVKPADTTDEDAFNLLVKACTELSDYAEKKGVTLAFEPEPGMFVDTLAKYDKLATAVKRRPFKLTIDIGHLVCNEPSFPADIIRNYSWLISNIHIDDMRPGVHEHLFFGQGKVDFAAITQALKQINYGGPGCVELSRHSHDAVETARKAKVFLDKIGLAGI